MKVDWNKTREELMAHVYDDEVAKILGPGGVHFVVVTEGALKGKIFEACSISDYGDIILLSLYPGSEDAFECRSYRTRMATEKEIFQAKLDGSLYEFENEEI